MLRGGGFWFVGLGGFVAAGVGRVSLLGTQVLSRDRELAADAGLAGRPRPAAPPRWPRRCGGSPVSCA